MLKYRIMIVIIFALLFLLVDFYFFQAVVGVSRNWNEVWKNLTRYLFWVPTLLSVAALLWWAFDDPYRYNANFRNWVITGLIGTYFSKIFGVLILFAGDVQRGLSSLIRFFNHGSQVEGLPGPSITRSEFFSQAAIVASTIPFGAFTFGILSGAHDYRLRKVTVKLDSLPKEFDGFRIGQISDIHSGSFWNKTAVKGGVEMLMTEKPDLIAFTGDLVNNETSEVKNYMDVFDKLKAPMGVFSVTGNHDYGDYRPWSTQKEKQKNFSDLVAAHRQLGFQLLMNSNNIIELSGEKIAIIGIENWGAGRFSKYGKLGISMEGTEEIQTKILLSHDPSHWDAEVRKNFSDIGLTLSGHTHGFQFGVEIAGFKWSPSQYIYKQWAGLYQEGKQYLYVNRGFGYLGYPGRVGIPPEITLIELKRA